MWILSLIRTRTRSVQVIHRDYTTHQPGESDSYPCYCVMSLPISKCYFWNLVLCISFKYFIKKNRRNPFCRHYSISIWDDGQHCIQSTASLPTSQVPAAVLPLAVLASEGRRGFITQGRDNCGRTSWGFLEFNASGRVTTSTLLDLSVVTPSVQKEKKIERKKRKQKSLQEGRLGVFAERGGRCLWLQSHRNLVRTWNLVYWCQIDAISHWRVLVWR